MSTKKAPKKKTEPKLVKGGKRSKEIAKAFDSLLESVPEPRVRIGSIVEYVPEGTVMLVTNYDDNEYERQNENDPKDRYTWMGISLSNPSYEECMYVSDRMIETGEAKIIGHFDIYSLVNGNDKR